MTSLFCKAVWNLSWLRGGAVGEQVPGGLGAYSPADLGHETGNGADAESRGRAQHSPSRSPGASARGERSAPGVPGASSRGEPGAPGVPGERRDAELRGGCAPARAGGRGGGGLAGGAAAPPGPARLTGGR